MPDTPEVKFVKALFRQFSRSKIHLEIYLKINQNLKHMKFNKLYLHGFKSFVDKTSVDFHSGITAIVGPNGSGKSNIMDAVRWVFGEQNAKELRGTDMEDVVFNGSQKRKSAGFAEVGLTLSDIDETIASKYGTFSDITITRKFYKTGEREYYINNRKCRLKDIKDIFMDTGLGARSISIIEQGKVDKIVNATPEELRFFLEETAGVTKFKDKKKEAERRLEQTKDNLDRVNDIITEIVARTESLSAQVEVLKKGEELQSRKRTLEKKYLCSAYASKASERTELSAKLEAKKKELEEKLAAYAGIARKEAETSALYAKIEKEHGEIQEKRLETSTKVTKTDGEIAALEARLASSGDLKTQLEKDIAENEERLSSGEEAAEAMAEELETAETALEEINEKIETLQDTVEDIKAQKSSLEEDFHDIDAKFLEITSLITDKRNDIIRLETNIESQKSSIERLTNEKNEIIKTAEEIKKSGSDILKNYEYAEKHSASLEEKLQKLKKDANIIKERLDENKIKQSEISASLKHMKENSAFLETQIQDSAFGKEAGGFMEKFAPASLLDRLSDISKEQSGEFGDIFIFKDEDKDALIKEAEKLKTSMRFIFESGFEELEKNVKNWKAETVSPQIYFSGGIYKKTGDEDKAAKISSLKERLKQEKDKAYAMKEELSLITEEIADTETEYLSQSEEISQTERNLQNVRTSLTKYKAEAESLKNDEERTARRLSTIEKEIELASGSFMETEEKLSIMRTELDELANKQNDIENNRLALEEKLEYIGGNLDEKREEMQELKIMSSARGEKLNSVKKEMETSARERENIARNLENLRNRLYKLINEDEAAWTAAIGKLKEDLITFKTQLLEDESSLKISSGEMEKLREELESLKKDGEKANNSIKETDDEARKTELNIASVAASVESDAAGYAEKFGENIAEVYTLYAEENFQPKKAKEEISSIETEIEGLGPLNLNAENDYEESRNRYEFLTKQRTDLEGSVADINGFINDTDETTVKMFQETFESVRNKFVEVFHILFGGGEAELRLTEPDNPLSTGVEIYIQPPGKKLQHMGLLSGGEKALTAMTLLFALFLQKPTPFCFLDEVDAPLDDANVERYINMVKTLADKTQFILITHNHNTMATADSLYGVTMQEYGVSTILSVKLEDAARAGR